MIKERQEGKRRENQKEGEIIGKDSKRREKEQTGGEKKEDRRGKQRMWQAEKEMMGENRRG